MKKRIWKQLEHIKALVAKIEQWNEFVSNNTYLERYGKDQLSFNAKLYVWLEKEDVAAFIKKRGLMLLSNTSVHLQ